MGTLPTLRARLNEPNIFPPVSKDHAAAVGYVAIHWSAVEHAASHLVYTLLGLPQAAGLALTAEMNSLTTVNLATVLVDLTGNAEWQSEWKAIELLYEKLRPLRNDAVHAEWHIVGTTHYEMRVKAKRKYRISFIPRDESYLYDIANGSTELSEMITLFLGKLIRSQASKLVMQTHPPGLTQAPTPPAPKQVRGRGPRPPKLSSAQKRAAAKNAAP